jgi:hypothetical protein
MRSLPFAVALIVLSASFSNAQEPSVPAAASEIAVDASRVDAPAAQPQAHAAAVEYSHGYEVRAKVHKYASIAMLPLFATDVALGQSLYTSSTDTKRSAHVAVGAGIGGLFAVNTVTGVWNLLEARKDPNKRGLRMLHGLLMLGADAGFLATGAMAPENEHGRSTTFTADRNTHRAVALTSMGVATAGYLVACTD